MSIKNQEIKTERTLLRKYREEDREAAADLLTDMEICKYMGGGPCKNRNAAYSLFDKIFQIYGGSPAKRYFEIWAIEIHGVFAGDFELKQTENTKGKELEVVYILDKPFWGKGYMPEILREINRYACKKGYKLIATLKPENTNSKRVLEKIGIEKEGWIGSDGDKTYKVWLTKLKPDAEIITGSKS